MFKLNSRIKLGRFTFLGGVNEVKVNRSVYIIMDTAHVKLPALAVVLDKPLGPGQSSVETAKLFQEGDPVTIELGYNGEYREEFTGFIRRVTIGKPVTLDLEGYGWQLRRKNILKSWRVTTLLEVLKEVVKGTDITLSQAIPHVPLEKFYIPSWNGLRVLDHIKDSLQLTVYFTGKELYAGLEQGLLKGETDYRLGWNVIRDDGLRYRSAENTKVQVEVQRALGKSGGVQVYKTGDEGGDKHTIKLPYVKQTEDIKKIGDEALQRAKYTGYQGKITAFLQPYCEPGYKAVIDDVRYGERSGAFFVTSTEVTFGMKGARRTVELSHKLDGAF